VKLGAIFLLAVGLAMDATAVAAARGLATQRIQARHMFLVAGLFGGFQALMPLLGWLLGAQIGPWIKAWDHWVVFILLGALGLRMLNEARETQAEAAAIAAGSARVRTDESENAFGLRLMLGLAIATSIDALAAGITLPLMEAPLAVTLTTIGVTTAVLSVLGLLAGRRFGAALGPRLDIAGGWMLIALGTKTLLEHLLTD
jgi:putative Mn2+ efflux pump MntP